VTSFKHQADSSIFLDSKRQAVNQPHQHTTTLKSFEERERVIDCYNINLPAIVAAHSINNSRLIVGPNHNYLKMKNVVAFLLLLSIPCEILSFSVRPTSVTSRRINAQQNNWVLNAVEQKEATSSEVAQTNGAVAEAEVEEEEELSETKKLLQKVKQAGTAGAISYALWELGFWGVSTCRIYRHNLMYQTRISLYFNVSNSHFFGLYRCRSQSV